MLDQENLLRRINELLELKWRGEQSYDVVGEVYSGTIAITSQIWGANSPHVEAVKQLREDIQASKWDETGKAENIILQCQGTLRSIANDIKSGRLLTLRLEYQGQVFADFINAAKVAMSEETKDVASVLIAAALEDTLKRFAEAKGLDVEDKDLTQVINALKAARLLSASKSSLLKGMTTFRNKALHAEWDKIGTEEVQGVIAFLEEFLSRNYV